MNDTAPATTLRGKRLALSARSGPTALLSGWSWELALAVGAVAAAVVACWVTLDAGFLAHSGWLAVQKADFILGPIGVGLYWRHRRPDNRLGLLLIVLGLLGVIYTLQSSTVPALFGVGLLCEFLIGFWTVVVILAFPSGRLDGLVPRLLASAMLVGVVLPGLVVTLTAPALVPSLPISGCKGVCPANGLAVGAPPSWQPVLLDLAQVVLIVVALATICLLVWRFATGTPPRRRALAIGAPIALLFLLAEASYWTKFLLLSPNSGSMSQEPITGVLQWTYAGAPSVLWYGFLFALVVAELFAGRVLRGLVRASLGRPSFGELEGMVREPLGDPGLRLGFWRPSTCEWVASDGTEIRPPGVGEAQTQVERDGRPAAVIVHDEQLAEDPELLQAAGAAALLAVENAELDAAWRDALRALADSRARLTTAGDRERRKLERDLHDGAQQKFVAAEINLALASDLATDGSELNERLTDARVELEEGLEELREVAHGIYPRALARWGLPRALTLLAARYPGKATVTAADVERCAPEIEAAVYYGCIEAVQNASKHAGRDAHVWICLHTDAQQLFLEVRDDGRVFEVDAVHGGVGLQNIRDRFGAVGGRAEIRSEPGHGTVVLAAVPHRNRPTRDPEPGRGM